MIRGVVLDSAGRSLRSAGISVRSARDSALVGGAISGPTGAFRVDALAPGQYRVRVSAVGYTLYLTFNYSFGQQPGNCQRGPRDSEREPEMEIR